MYQTLSYQVKNRCQSSSPLLWLEVCKNHYERENISVVGREQREDALHYFFFISIPLKRPYGRYA